MADPERFERPTLRFVVCVCPLISLLFFANQGHSGVIFFNGLQVVCKPEIDFLACSTAWLLFSRSRKNPARSGSIRSRHPNGSSPLRYRAHQRGSTARQDVRSDRYREHHTAKCCLRSGLEAWRSLPIRLVDPTPAHRVPRHGSCATRHAG